MREKPTLWKKLTTLIVAMFAALLGSASSKALSVDKKNPSKQTIEERLANVREQIKINARTNQENSPTSSFSYTELISQQNDHIGRRHQENEWNNWNNWNKLEEWDKWANWNKWDNWNKQPTEQK